MQEVDRRRMDTQRAQFKGHVDQILIGFTHSYNQSAAKFHARVTNRSQGLQTIVVTVSRDNLVVECAAGIQIVIDPVDSCRFQGLGLFGLKETQTAADMQPVFVFDFGNGACDMVDFTVTGTTP